MFERVRHHGRLAAVFALLLTMTAPARAEELHHGGPSEDRMDLVMISEGFTAGERDRFIRDTDDILKALKTLEPWKSYINCFNVHRAFLPARASGLGDATKTRYGTYRVGRSTTIKAKDMAGIVRDAQDHATEADFVLVVVNDRLRGGTASGMVGFVANYGWYNWIAVHELGHVVADLADEYVKPERLAHVIDPLRRANPGNPDRAVETFLKAYLGRKPNVSAFAERSRLPWADWIQPGTPLPTRDTGAWSTVGAFEGGYYLRKFVYRARLGCRMNVSERGLFCEACRQALVLSFHEQSRPSRLVVSRRGSSARVSVVTALPKALVTWSDGRETDRRVRDFDLRREAGRSITVTVRDTMGWVRGEAHRATLVQTLRVTLPGPPASPSEPATPQPSPEPTPSVTTPTPTVTTPTPTVTTPTPTVTRGRVTGVSTRLRVRLAPGTSSPIMDHLQPGELVEVLGEPVPGWLRVRFRGRTGYTSKRYVKVVSGPGLGAPLRSTGD